MTHIKQKPRPTDAASALSIVGHACSVTDSVKHLQRDGMMKTVTSPIKGAYSESTMSGADVTYIDAANSFFSSSIFAAFRKFIAFSSVR